MHPDRPGRLRSDAAAAAARPLAPHTALICTCSMLLKTVWRREAAAERAAAERAATGGGVMVDALRAVAVTGGSGSNGGDDGGGHGARFCDCVHDARRAGTARTPRSGDGSSGDGSSVRRRG